MRDISIIAAALTACIAAPASAQTFGPPIEGLCLLSRDGAIAGSQAGQSLQAQVRQRQATLAGDLARQKAAIDQQRNALEARRNSIAPIEYQRQRTALDQQMQSVEQQQNERFIAAQTQGQRQIDQALNQALARVVTRSACSVLFERDNAYGWNNAMDITGAVTQEMNTILQTVSLP